MAISATSIDGTTLTGSSITSGIITANTTMYNSSYRDYNMNHDTIYGIPSRDWQRMSASEQRHWAERYEHERNYREAMLYEEKQKQKQVLVKKAHTADFLNNTLLLLEN